MSNKISLQILHDGQFFTGIFEKFENNSYKVARVISIQIQAFLNF